jgi:glycogen operon protein
MMNMFWEPLTFEIPSVEGRRWRRAVDTCLPSPADIAAPGQEPAVEGPSYTVGGRGIAVLVSR